eukprot:5194881-Lingulodinium_polyedra.AAC.1
MQAAGLPAAGQAMHAAAVAPSGGKVPTLMGNFEKELEELDPGLQEVAKQLRRRLTDRAAHHDKQLAL